MRPGLGCRAISVHVSSFVVTEEPSLALCVPSLCPSHKSHVSTCLILCDPNESNELYKGK